MEDNNFDQFQIDIINEMATIASGNANTVLSKITNKKIEIISPDIFMLSRRKLIEYLKNEESSIALVYSSFKKDIVGDAIFYFDFEKMKKLLKISFENYEITADDADSMEFTEGAFVEIGNMYIGGYINSLCKLLDLDIERMNSVIAKDNMSNLSEQFARKESELDENLICFKTTIYIKDSDIKGYFLFIPKTESIYNATTKAKEMYNQMLTS